jgi:prepilin-type N-terminal cleavage/methylation domain-containing protein
MGRTLNKFSTTRGMSLIETMIAMTILLIGLVSVMSMFTVSVAQNANQGEFATRTTEYAQDKMEQLLALSFSDTATNTTVYPPVSTGGTGLGSGLTAGNTVGSVDTSGTATTGYVDYLDSTGTLLTSSTGWFYKRQWSISLNATGTLKTITVVAITSAQAGRGVMPSTTLVSFKANVP